MEKHEIVIEDFFFRNLILNFSISRNFYQIQ